MISSIGALKTLAHEWLPPAILRLIQQWRGVDTRFEGEFSSWAEAAAQCTGYDGADILDKVLMAAIKVKTGKAKFERDSVVFNHIEYDWPVLSGLLRAAARDEGRLN